MNPRGSRRPSNPHLHQLSASTRPGHLGRLALAFAGSLLLAACGGNSPHPNKVVVTHVVTASARAGGSISPASDTVNDGASATFTVTADAGYLIANVTGCGGTLSGSTYTTGPITADCTVTASFAVQQHTVTATAGTGGSISPSSAKVNDGATASFTVTPAAGHLIANVTGCGGTLSGSTYVTGALTADCTVTASFVVVHTVTASAGTGGSLSPASATVRDGQTATFTATPDSGYLVGTVTGCGGTLSGNSYTTGAISADCTVTASFALAPVLFTNGQPASVVIGQPDFTTHSCGNVSQTQLNYPYGAPDVINGALYLPDYSNSRVLGFNAIPTTNGAAADFVLGAQDFTSTGTLNSVEAVADANGKLFVDALGLSQVDVFDPLPTASTTPPMTSTSPAPSFSITASAAGGLTDSEAISIGGGKLVLADSYDNRVLIWNTVPTADTAPDLVLGQTDFTGTAVNQGLPPSAATMRLPTGVWTDGTRLVVLDTNNNRVLIWNTFPTTDDQPADLVLGQTIFSGAGSGLSASAMAMPSFGVFVRGSQLFVSDNANRRVLIWNHWPTQNGQPADAVLGQPDFTSSSSGPTQTLMVAPSGMVLSGNRLIVDDSNACRALIFQGTYGTTP